MFDQDLQLAVIAAARKDILYINGAGYTIVGWKRNLVSTNHLPSEGYREFRYMNHHEMRSPLPPYIATDNQ